MKCFSLLQISCYCQVFHPFIFFHVICSLFHRISFGLFFFLFRSRVGYWDCFFFQKSLNDNRSVTISFMLVFRVYFSFLLSHGILKLLGAFFLFWLAVCWLNEYYTRPAYSTHLLILTLKYKYDGNGNRKTILKCAYGLNERHVNWLHELKVKGATAPTRKRKSK